MKLHIASDLHLEHLTRRFPDHKLIKPVSGADVLVLAGDIHSGLRVLEEFADWPTPVIYVFGNHELYGFYSEEIREEMRKRSEGTQVRFLDNSVAVLGEGKNAVRFIGATLWTDYKLYAGKEAQSKAFAGRSLADHRLIGTAGVGFTTAHAQAEHEVSRKFIETEMGRPFDGKTVVVTHHAPHPGSTAPRFIGNALNGAFMSDLSAMMGSEALWIHGHVHDGCDYRVGKTRVLANPRGYPLNIANARTPAQLVWENPKFRSDLVVNVD